MASESALVTIVIIVMVIILIILVVAGFTYSEYYDNFYKPTLLQLLSKNEKWEMQQPGLVKTLPFSFKILPNSIMEVAFWSSGNYIAPGFMKVQGTYTENYDGTVTVVFNKILENATPTLGPITPWVLIPYSDHYFSIKNNMGVWQMMLGWNNTIMPPFGYKNESSMIPTKLKA